IISGSYPGGIYLFAGSANGGFERGIEIADQGGERVDVGSATSPFAVDWDRDGDLDLLIGNMHGEVFFLPNQSSNRQLLLGDAKELKLGKEDMDFGAMDSAPHVSDWDGDGNHDLLLGTSDGRVEFYRNLSNRGLPDLAPPVELIPETPYQEIMDTDYSPSNGFGHYSKPWIGDWNNDGRPDLLLGTFVGLDIPEQALSQQMLDEKDEIEKEREVLSDRASLIRHRYEQEMLIEMRLDRRRRVSHRVRMKWLERAGEKCMQDEEFRGLQNELRRLLAMLSEFQTDRKWHGWVWVFLRK
ncbi:FG-GAP repeat domain-containing protein, partial [Candidatus Zixiibacteriota bacterium]